jgi:hypothetical protein
VTQQQTQLDKFMVAWRRLQDAVNVHLPNLVKRFAAIRARLFRS